LLVIQEMCSTLADWNPGAGVNSTAGMTATAAFVWATSGIPKVVCFVAVGAGPGTTTWLTNAINPTAVAVRSP
jgi:hypothetical protein